MNKLLGYNYFHTHPKMEKMLKVDNEHVIIDKNEYYEVLELLKNKTELPLHITNNSQPQVQSVAEQSEVEIAKEIADDVQQTVDNCSNEYRKVIENRILIALQSSGNEENVDYKEQYLALKQVYDAFTNPDTASVEGIYKLTTEILEGRKRIKELESSDKGLNEQQVIDFAKMLPEMWNKGHSTESALIEYRTLMNVMR